MPVTFLIAIGSSDIVLIVISDVSLSGFEEGCHESWIFPAGVSFALKQNMYWDGFCAFLPDISGLWGGGVFFFWRYSTVY